jgi:hypothetical protein
MLLETESRSERREVGGGRRRRGGRGKGVTVKESEHECLRVKRVSVLMDEEMSSWLMGAKRAVLSRRP